MKNLFLTTVLILILTQCGDNKKSIVYKLTIPHEITFMKGRLDTLEKMNLPGMEIEIKAMKTNLAVAELHNLDSYLADMMTEKIEQTGIKMSNEELLELKTQIKHDSIKASLEKIIELNRID